MNYLQQILVAAHSGCDSSRQKHCAFPGVLSFTATLRPGKPVRNISSIPFLLHRYMVGPVTLSIPLTSLNNWGLTTNIERAIKLARKFHAHPIMYANKLVTTRRAIENTSTAHGQVLEPGASSNSPDSHWHFLFYSFVVEGTRGSSRPICLLN
eukprot:1160831-Pelagomonas_calceolata.AAC.6